MTDTFHVNLTPGRSSSLQRIMAGMLLAALDQTIVATALPTILGDSAASAATRGS